MPPNNKEHYGSHRDLVPLALGLGLFFVAAFIWMTLSGQYDDLETPRLRMLLDETTREKNIQPEKGSAHEPN